MPVAGVQSGRRQRGACEVPTERADSCAACRVLSVSGRARATPSTRHGESSRAARLDVGGIEYLDTLDGRRVFYDINANSNLRPSVAAAFGFDPFERVVDFLEGQLARAVKSR